MEDAVSGACGTHGRRNKSVIFLVGGLKERNHFEDRGVDGRMGSEWILGRLAGWGVERIQLAQDRDRWWAFVNTVTSLSISKYFYS